ncbi:cupin domain-containing protein [Agilicoccus flavus]|uniref:cupin domain-containing protein n=1 Tax=Agilicoccus flavus TaxID=2775968 RepID=UPI001CF6877F|nr:cupin domain-containing protein [Agilicoccus flavus]
MTDASRPTLARLVGDTDDFASRVWGREPLLRRADGSVVDRLAADDPSNRADGDGAGESAEGFPDLFTLDDVDELVSVRGLRSPFLRLVKNGASIPESRWLGGGGTGAAIADQARDDGIHTQMAAGATLVLQGLHRMWPSLLAFAQDLTADLGHPTQVNAYITPAQSQGFGAHYDVHDVFVLQLSGRKRWFVHDPVFEVPLTNQPGDAHAAAIAERAATTPRIDAVLAPGDCLYLPRGYLHSAQALGDVSAHLTVGVPVWTRYDLVTRVLDRLQSAAAADPALREAFGVGADIADPAVLSEHVDVVRDALRRAVEDVDVADLATALTGVAERSERAAPVRPLAQIRAARDLAAGQRFVLRGSLRPRIGRRDDGAIELTGRFTPVVLPPSERADLDAILAAPGQPVTVPDDPNAPLARLVARLVRAGILVPA